MAAQKAAAKAAKEEAAKQKQAEAAAVEAAAREEQRQKQAAARAAGAKRNGGACKRSQRTAVSARPVAPRAQLAPPHPGAQPRGAARRFGAASAARLGPPQG